MTDARQSGESEVELTGLPREEHVEQAYFFKSLLERLDGQMPIQELMETARHEVLATAKSRAKDSRVATMGSAQAAILTLSAAR